MKTFTATPSDIEKKWVLIDADGVVLGRLASQVAKILPGKHKPSFTPHLDCGANVILVHAERVQLNGKKRTDKTLYWHTDNPGGLNKRKHDPTHQGHHPHTAIVTPASSRHSPHNTTQN